MHLRKTIAQMVAVGLDVYSSIESIYLSKIVLFVKKKYLIKLHQSLHGSNAERILKTLRLNELLLRKKTIPLFELQKLRETVLLLHYYVRNSGSENLKHLQVNEKR